VAAAPVSACVLIPDATDCAGVAPAAGPATQVAAPAAASATNNVDARAKNLRVFLMMTNLQVAYV
jgi:hypothetical protein